MNPIISKFLSQECIGYKNRRGYFTSIIESVVICDDGKQYYCLTDSWFDEGGFGHMSRPYNFIPMDVTEKGSHDDQS